MTTRRKLTTKWLILKPSFVLLSLIFIDNAMSAANTASIVFAGADLTTNGKWRTSTVSKTLDIDKDNIYGSDGYILITSPDVNLSEPPAYAAVENLTPLEFKGGNTTKPTYLSIDNPKGSEDLFTGTWFYSGNAHEEHNFVVITVTKKQNMRIGVLIDSHDYPDISPINLHMKQTAGGSADSGVIKSNLEPDLNGDWYFFDLSNVVPGDQFTLSGTNSRSRQSNGISAITFDSLPSSRSIWSFMPNLSE